MTSNIAASCSVWPNREATFHRNYVDWLQVSDIQRGNGYGEELLYGIEDYLGEELSLHPTSLAAERMLERMGRDADLELSR